MNKRFILVFIFSSLILNAYGVPRPMGSEGTILLLFSALFLIVNGILFINSVFQRFLLDYKKYYKKIYWYSFFVILSAVLLQISGGKALTNQDYYILGFILLVCIVNLIIGNRSIFSSSDKVQPKD